MFGGIRVSKQATVWLLSVVLAQPVPPQVTEQTLRALGAATCADLLALRGVLAALYSAISSDFFIAAALGIGRTRHSEMVREGEVRRLLAGMPPGNNLGSTMPAVFKALSGLQ